MSRLISDILKAPEPHFSHAIMNLEKITGSKGHDVRLVSDVTLNRKKAIKELNLDEKDTTARELYFALRHKAKETSIELEKKLGINESDDPHEVVAKIVDFINDLELNKEVWVLKQSVIKQMLKSAPPKKTLKALGLRSADSMLKRNNPCELLTIAYQIESPEWTAKARAKYKKLKNTDLQPIESSVFVATATRAEKLRKSSYKSSKLVTPNYETGSVYVVPSSKRFNFDSLAITLSILQSLYELRVYSAYFRLISVKDKFGENLHDAVVKGFSSKISEKEIGWKVLQKHLNVNDAAFNRLEQPHFQQEDIILKTPIQTLSEELPVMRFWDGYEHVYIYENGNPVSLHLLDVVVNASNGLLCEDGVCVYLQQDLLEELMLRYLQHETIQDQAIKRFEEV